MLSYHPYLPGLLLMSSVIRDGYLKEENEASFGFDNRGHSSRLRLVETDPQG